MIQTNNIYHGDSYKLIKEIPDNSIDLIVTDPPYMVETQGAGFFGKNSDEYSMNYKDKKQYGHPTIKPLDIIKNFIINSSNDGDIVLDPFMGSGTTCVAAKELGRKYIGFEINEKYFNIAKDRLNGFNQKGVMDLFTYDYEKGEEGNE